MAEVVLFHHALGLTAGVVAFADDLRRAGHTVHTPDLLAGRTFATLGQQLLSRRVLSRGTASMTVTMTMTTCAA